MTRKSAALTALLISAGTLFGQQQDTAILTVPDNVSAKEVQTQEIQIEKQQAAAGFTGSQGKEAVIKRLEALFKGTNKPVVHTKKFIPAAPYLSVTDIPEKDEQSLPRSIIIYRFRFVNVKKAQSAVEAALGDAGTADISEPQNSIIINVLRSKVPAMKAALLAMDMPLPQVLVETQIIEVLVKQGEERDVKMEYMKYDASTHTTTKYGYDLQSPTQSRTSESSGFDFFPYQSGEAGGDLSQFNIALRWLTTSSDAKILAAPNVIADLGTVASMITGEELPYTENSVTQSAVTQSIKFKRTGVKLNITPELINSDTVQLTVNPEITTVVRYQKFVQPGSTQDAQQIENSIPVVSVRNITTRLTAADGEIIMLGGLYSSEQSESLRKTPFLSDIPLFGEFFTAKDATTYDKQLIFFMKIHILPSPYSVALDPEKTATEIKDISKMIYDSNKIFSARPYPTLSETLQQRPKDDSEKKESGFGPYLTFLMPKEEKKTETKKTEAKTETPENKEKSADPAKGK